MIPFFKPNLGEEEKRAINDVIDSGWVVMGKKTQEFEEKFAEYVGAKYAVFVDSGTSALFLALKCTDFKAHYPELEHINIPSLTFASDAEVVVHYGLKPHFEDVNKEDFCMKYDGLNTTGYFGIPVHLTGNRSDIVSLIYDSAHRIEKDDVKDSGAIWCYSFYATKNMTTINGGMIALNDKDEYEWLKKARDHGMTKGTQERYNEKLPYYDIEFAGWRVKADDIRAAIGIEQLKKLPEMTQKRNEIVKRYNKNLGLRRTGNHLYPILVNNRDEFFKRMREAEIQCSVHFLPLHKMTAYQKYYNGEDLKNTEYFGSHFVSIPLFPQMTDEQIDYVSDKVLEMKLLINE